MLKIKGIDVSRAQEQFDFDAAVKAGVKFVIIRAGIRTDEDTYFRRNLSECQKRNMPYGLYWYFEATSDDAFKAELAACKKSVKGLKPSYPVFFDMEEQKQIDNLTTAQRTDMALKFCAEMTAIGLPSGIYANPSWMLNYYDSDRLDGIDIWLANWTHDPEIPSQFDFGQLIWQWGVENIGGKDVDSDICFIAYPAKTDYWYKTHSGTDTPAKPSEEPVKPDTTPIVKTYKAGDVVQLSNTALYGSSTTSQPANHLTGTYYIHTADDTVNGRIRITTPKGCSAVTGWVKVDDIGGKTADKPTAEIRKGDRVQIKQGATWYGGTKVLTGWLLEKTWIVDEVVGNRAVLGKDTTGVFNIQSPIDVKYLKR